MSPKNLAQDVDVPMVVQGGRGSSDLAPAPNVSQEQAQAQELADTPVKVQLRREVGQLREVVKYEEMSVHQ